MRSALRLPRILLALTLTTAACGDPGFSFWVRNDSPSDYLLTLVVRVKEVDIQDPGIIVFDAPALTEGLAYTMSGTWAGEVALLTPTCATVSRFSAPGDGGVVWIRPDGAAELVDFRIAFPDFYASASTTRMLTRTAECRAVASPPASP